jgi:hypothetical protein
VVVSILDAGKGEEVAAALGADVLLEGLAPLRRFCTARKPSSRLRWNDTKARPWSRRPASSKPRE